MTFKQIEPQPARGEEYPDLWLDNNGWWAEQKFDGDRRIAQFTEQRVRFTGRRIGIDGKYVEKTDNLPHLNTPIPALVGTVLDGEIVAGAGTTSKDVTSIMGSLPDKAIKKQAERGWLTYVVFDCLEFKGKDIRNKPLTYRFGKALHAVEVWKSRMPYVRASDYATCGKRAEYEQIVAKGGEGVMLKRMDSEYGDRRAWVKVKKSDTADLFIMGYTPGNGKWAGVAIGSIKLGVYKDGREVQVANVSGMDDALRMQLTANKTRHFGKVVEIEHNGFDKESLTFRHPRFKRFRPDKGAAQCRIETL